MSQRTEWPTPQRLAELRSQGMVPISYSSLRYALVSLTFLLIGIFAGSLPSQLNNMTYAENPFSLFLDLLVSISIFLMSAVFVVFLIGLFQTRFLFRIGKGQPVLSIKSGADRFFDMIIFVTNLALILTAAILIVRYVWPVFLNILTQGPDQIIASLGSGFSLIIFGIAILTALMALSVWLRDRYRFMLKNRMSKAEINAEGRD